MHVVELVGASSRGHASIFFGIRSFKLDSLANVLSDSLVIEIIW